MNDSKKLGIICIIPGAVGLGYMIYSTPIFGVALGMILFTGYGALKLVEE